MRLEESKQRLADVAEGAEVLALDQDEVRTQPLGLADEHELAHALGAGVVVACCENVLLLDTQRLGFEGRVLVLDNLGVEAVVVLGLKM